MSYKRNVNRMRTVVHVIVAGHIGGAERLLIDLAKRSELSRSRHVVALMTPNPALRDLLRNAGLQVVDRGRVHENPLAYLWRSLGPADVRWLTQLLQNEKADVAHLHTFASHVIGVRAAERVGIPTVRTEHHVDYFRDPSTAPFTWWSLRRVHRSVAISRYVAEVVAKLAPALQAKLRTVRNGVDADFFHVPRSPKKKGPFTFAVVSRLEPWKRIDRVIEALGELADAELLITGDGSDRPRLEKRVQALGLAQRVKFQGYLRDPRTAIEAADVCVNASDNEPLGLSVLEALAMQRPVIAFAGGGVLELVQHEKTGWLVAERSAHALAEIMKQAVRSRDRLEEMGTAARAFVEREGRVELMCEGYAAVYDELTPPRGGELEAAAP